MFVGIHFRTLVNYIAQLNLIIFITSMTSFQSFHLSTPPPSQQNNQKSNKVEAKSDLQKQQVVCIEKEQKRVKIKKKPQSMLRKLMIQSPIGFSHVHSIFNIIAINQLALKNANFQQSYFKSLFYINTVEKVQARKHAVIVDLRPFQRTIQPIQYLINRYKSFGDKNFYLLANSLENILLKLNPSEFTRSRMRSFAGEPLSRFIDSMDDQIYICRVAPNKLVISRRLLELLGEDAQHYSVQLCKYKMPLREIISTEYYSSIMNKSVENIGLICDFIEGTITQQQLHTKTSVQFNDYLYNRQHKKIYCKFLFYMPTPHMSCVKIEQIIKETEEVKRPCILSVKNRTLIEDQCQKIRYSQVDVLKKIAKIPSGLLKKNEQKVAGIKSIKKQ